MGYKEVSGLGKNEQGIVAPIEAKRMGVGSKDKRWSKQKQGKKKVEILTADELLAKEQEQEQGIEVVQKVVDMRGRQPKVWTSLENSNVEVEMKENDVPMSELQYNVRLVVDTIAVDIQKLDPELRREREKVVSLQMEKEKNLKEEARRRQLLQVMETIARVIERIKEDNLSGAFVYEHTKPSTSG